MRPRLADWVYVTLLDDYGDVREFAARHKDGRDDDLQEFAGLHVRHLGPGSPSRRAWRRPGRSCSRS